MDDRIEGGTTLLYFASTSAVERVPLKKLYAVFRRPRNDADRSAGEIAAPQGALDFGHGGPGRPRPSDVSDEDWLHAQLGNVVMSEGRLLLARLGGDADMLYAAPTDNDAVAHALLPNGGGCSYPGPHGIEMGWHQEETGDLVLFGLVGDSVEAVDVILAEPSARAHGRKRVRRAAREDARGRAEATCASPPRRHHERALAES